MELVAVLERFLDSQRRSMKLTIEMKSQTGKDPGTLSDPAGASSSDPQREGVPGLPGLAGRGGRGDLLSRPSTGMRRQASKQFMRSGSGGALLGAIDLLSETARVRLGEQRVVGRDRRPEENEKENIAPPGGAAVRAGLPESSHKQEHHRSWTAKERDHEK